MGAFTPLNGTGGSSPFLSILVDEVSASVSYVGMASPGTAVGAAGWQIRRITMVSGDLEVLYADAGRFTQVWNDRLSLSYT